MTKKEEKKKERKGRQLKKEQTTVPYKKKVCMGKVAKAEDKKVCTAHREILH